MKDKTVDLVASRDNSSASLVRALKNLKKVRRRKNPKPIITSPVKKKHHRRALLESPTNDKVFFCSISHTFFFLIQHSELKLESLKMMISSRPFLWNFLRLHYYEDFILQFDWNLFFKVMPAKARWNLLFKRSWEGYIFWGLNRSILHISHILLEITFHLLKVKNAYHHLRRLKYILVAII